MRPNPLRQKIAAGKPVIGPLLQEIPASPELAEFMIAAGFDFVIIDGEHGGASTETVRAITQAVESFGGCTLVRVPSADPTRILAFLDQGVMGVVLAHCATVEDAENLVKAVKYPPRGIRGAASGSRAALYGYGGSSHEHVNSSNQETMAFGLIEDLRAIPNIPGMLEIDGYDGCFLGAGDLSLSMGMEYYGQSPMHPEVKKLIDQVRDQTMAAGKMVIAPAGGGADAKALFAQGIPMVVVQFGQLFRGACTSYLQAARG